MEIFFGVMIFVFGLCFGSFVNMLVYRTAKKYKLIKKEKGRGMPRPYNKNRSFCDYCGKQLSWYENIPVLSWLMLKGKTKCCHKKLSLSYPIVELLMGILFVVFYFVGAIHELPLLTGLGFLIVVFLVFSAVFDLRYMILPDFSTIILIICAIVFLLVEIWGRHIGLPLQQILSALVAAGFLLILNLITKGKGMGMGDVKLAIFMGLFLGYPKIIVAFYVAFIIGAIYGLALMIFKKADKKSQVPFGPFMILGFFMAWWCGEKIVKLIGL